MALNKSMLQLSCWAHFLAFGWHEMEVFNVINRNQKSPASSLPNEVSVLRWRSEATVCLTALFLWSVHPKVSYSHCCISVPCLGVLKHLSCECFMFWANYSLVYTIFFTGLWAKCFFNGFVSAYYRVDDPGSWQPLACVGRLLWDCLQTGLVLYVGWTY